METRRKIAQRVRHQAELWAVNNCRVNPATLNRACAVASAALALRFIAEGYRASIVVMDGSKEGHCFVYSGGKVYDLTATQFWNVARVHTPRNFVNYGKKVVRRCGHNPWFRHFSTNQVKSFQFLPLLEDWTIPPTEQNINAILSCPAYD